MNGTKNGLVEVGERHGKLVVMEPAGKHRSGLHQFLCQCDCGKRCVVPSAWMRSGNTRSCGCLGLEGRKKHGHSPGARGANKHSRTYDAWANMKARCSRQSRPDYASYGGRGISVCPEWLEFTGFLASMGECPAGLFLDRIDNDGNYEPGNCRWATRIEQNRNTRKTRYLTLAGETLCVAAWAEKLGVSVDGIHARLSRGWSDERTLTEPFATVLSVGAITHAGKTQSAIAWARELGLAKTTVYRRLKRGLPAEEILLVAGPG